MNATQRACDRPTSSTPLGVMATGLVVVLLLAACDGSATTRKDAGGVTDGSGSRDASMSRDGSNADADAGAPPSDAGPANTDASFPDGKAPDTNGSDVGSGATDATAPIDGPAGADVQSPTIDGAVGDASMPRDVSMAGTAAMDAAPPTPDAPTVDARPADASVADVVPDLAPDMAPGTTDAGAPPDATATVDAPGPAMDGAVAGCSVTRTLSASESAAYASVAVGNRWTYQARNNLLPPPSDYAVTFQQRLEVTSQKTVNGSDAFVITDSSPSGNPTAIEEYLSVTDSGLIQQGVAAGVFEAQPGTYPAAAPYTEIPFPIRVCSAWQERRTPAAGGAVIVSSVLRSLETTTVSGVTFPDALKIERVISTENATAAGGAPTTTPISSTVEWYAPGVGRIKRSVQTSGRDATYNIIGARVGGTSRGVLPGGNLAMLDVYSSFLGDEKDRPSIASDGQNFMVVSSISTGLYAGGVAAVLVGPDGKTIKVTPVAEGTRAPLSPAIAYGDGRYLIAYRGWNTGIRAVMLGSDGTQMGTPIEIWGGGDPAVAYGGGAFLVANVHGPTGVGITRISAQGAVLGEVIPYPSSEPQNRPALAFDGKNFLMTWLNTTAELPNGGSTHVQAGRINADGNAIDVNATQVTKAATLQEDVDVTFDGARYVVSWLHRSDSSSIGSGGIRIARFTANGVLLDPDGRVAAPARSNTSQQRARIGRVGSQALVVWERINFSAPGHPYWIVGTRIDADGNSLDSSATEDGMFLSAPPNSNTILPAIGWGGGRALVAYIDRAGEGQKKRKIDSSMIFPWSDTPPVPPPDPVACTPRRCGVEIQCGVAADGCGSSVTCDPCADVARVLRVPGARHMVVDQRRGLIYVSVAGNSPTNPNTVLVVQPTPTTPKLVTTLAVGLEPNVLALSDDGTRLWVGTDGDSAVRRVDLGSGAPALGPQFKLPFGANYPYATTAGAMKALHSSADSIIVVLSRSATNVDPVGVVVLDNGVARGTAVHSGATLVATGPGDVVFGFNGWTTGYDFYRFQVSAQGVTQTAFPGLGTAFSHELTFAHDRVYSEGGDIFDVSTPTAPVSLGKLPNWGGIRPLPNDATRVLVGSLGIFATGATFRVVDAATRTTSAMMTIPGVTGYYVRDLDLVGTDSIAFVTNDSGPPGSTPDPLRPNLLVVARTTLLP